MNILFTSVVSGIFVSISFSASEIISIFKVMNISAGPPKLCRSLHLFRCIKINKGGWAILHSSYPRIHIYIFIHTYDIITHIHVSTDTWQVCLFFCLHTLNDSVKSSILSQSERTSKVLGRSRWRWWAKSCTSWLKYPLGNDHISYPALGKGKSASQKYHWDEDMLVPRSQDVSEVVQDFGNSIPMNPNLDRFVASWGNVKIYIIFTRV